MARNANTSVSSRIQIPKQKIHPGDMTCLAAVLSWMYLAILGLLPLHAFLTTWAGSNFGYLDVWRIWKEVIIVLTVPLVGYVLAKDKPLRVMMTSHWLFRLIYLYIGLYIGSGVLAFVQDNVNGTALIYSWLSNLRFLGFFIVVFAVARHSTVLQRYAVKTVAAVSVLVAMFGIVQKLLLPYDFLKHFGYGPDTIPAYQTVDNKLEYRRAQSTLRGSNPFGAYLVVIIPLIVSVWMRFRWWLAIVGSMMVIALFFSYSRSAYGGVFVALVFVALLVVKRRGRTMLIAGLIGVFIMGLLGVYALRDSPTVQNTLFHTDNNSQSATSSNEGRVSAMKQALYEVAYEPVGRGPGTAGPASTRNRYSARMSENYYLQIGQEVGWLGLALFVMILIFVGHELWLVRNTALGLGLFASLIGLVFVNAVSHAWADDTLGLLWWGLAGVALAATSSTAAQQKSKR